MERDDTLQIVRQMRAPFRLAPRKGLLGAVIGVGQMIDAGQQRSEELAVLDDAADRNAAEPNAVIAAFAADQSGAAALSGHVPIGERNLERRIDRLRAGIAEEHVVEIAGGELGDARRNGEPARMAELECRRIVELACLFLDRRRDLVAVMARIAAPQARRAVDDLSAFRRVVIHSLGAGDHARPLLERAIGREWQPPGLKIVRSRNVVGGASWLSGHVWFPANGSRRQPISQHTPPQKKSAPASMARSVHLASTLLLWIRPPQTA